MADTVQQDATQQSGSTNVQQPPVPANEEPQLSKIATLNAAEKYWVWKFGLRVFICVINIIAIGCAAWTADQNRRSYDGRFYYYGFGAYGGSPVLALVALSVSTVYCLCVMITPFFLKPPRPTHPGIAVGFDLILWLGMIVVGLVTVAIVSRAIDFGSDPTYLRDPSQYTGYGGSYYLAPNGTWVYHVTGGYVYNNVTNEYEHPTGDAAEAVRDCEPVFPTCAEQDAWVNRIWRQKGTRVATLVLTDAVLFLDVLLHFVLFVWACVDTNRYNRRRVRAGEQVVADRIMADLEKRGLITVENGVAVKRPAEHQQAYAAAAGYYGSEVAQDAIRPAPGR